MAFFNVGYPWRQTTAGTIEQNLDDYPKVWVGTPSVKFNREAVRACTGKETGGDCSRGLKERS